jgi:ubiquinone/menaquinone biosynthesis C-methylase UbiE
MVIVDDTSEATRGPDFGLERGKVFPASNAKSLLNPARKLVQSARRTVAAIEAPADARVLEIGCGPGFFSPSVAKAVPKGRLVCLDLQSEMLGMARDRLVGQSHVAFVQSDGSVLPFRSDWFDAVFIATVLGEIPDRGACMAEAARVLAPGGVLAIAETRRDSDFIALPELKTLVEPHGFRYANHHGVRWQYLARFSFVG